MAEPVANDYVPLAFLLGTRASLYAPKRSTSQSITGSSSSRGSGASSGGNGHAPLRAAGRVELFSPEVHPRAREEEARRVLQQTLLARDDSAGVSKGNGSGASPTPTSVLRGHKDLVLRQVLENRAQEEGDDQEPRLRREGGTQVGYDGEDSELNHTVDDLRAKGSHGYERADKVVSFLGVAGQATRIPLLSTQEAKRIHQRVMKRQSERRAHRADEMHALFHEQQQLTRQVLRLAPASSLPASKQVSRVDLGVNIGDSDPLADRRHEHPDSYQNIANARTGSSLAEQHEVHQQQLRERVQEKRHTELLTRQQMLAYRQEQKKVMIGRAKNIKRPSFLATLQLDKTETQYAVAPEETTPSPPKDLRGALIAPLRTEAQPKKPNQTDESSLGRLQRNVFLQSEGGGRQLFGGGFKKASRKSTESSGALASVMNGHKSPRDHADSVAGTAHAIAAACTKTQESTQQQQQRSAGRCRRTPK